MYDIDYWLRCPECWLKDIIKDQNNYENYEVKIIKNNKSFCKANSKIAAFTACLYQSLIYLVSKSQTVLLF